MTNFLLIPTHYKLFQTLTFWISASLGMRKVLWACLMASLEKAAPSRWGAADASATATNRHTTNDCMARNTGLGLGILLRKTPDITNSFKAPTTRF